MPLRADGLKVFQTVFRLLRSCLPGSQHSVPLDLAIDGLVGHGLLGSAEILVAGQKDEESEILPYFSRRHLFASLSFSDGHADAGDETTPEE